MKTLMNYFEDIAAIPHISGQEAALADYVEAFAQNLGLACIRDGMHNLVVVKPASPGYEEAGAVLLQGHLDMVGAKRDGVDHDFLLQPIRLVQQGDILQADGTTLGADDGVAVAYMLALLADATLRHPRLECVFTTQEETGLFGAQALDTSMLQATRMINLDAGPEGIFLVSCAGGCRVKLTRPLRREPSALPAWELRISGLKSGHSGADMPAERANALVLAGHILDRLRDQGLRIASIAGGDKDNVIPPAAQVIFVAEGDPTALVSAAAAEIRSTWEAADPGISITLSPAEAGEALCSEDSQAVADLLLLLPHGVVSLSAAMPGLIETSANLAAVHMDGDLVLQMSLRSSADLRKAQILRRVERIAELCGAAVEVSGAYPGWAYQPDSPLRDRAVGVYQELFGQEPKVEGIHAGLECGVLKGKLPHLDILAIGPAYGAMHTPEEWLNIPSFNRYHQFLIKLLEELR